MDRARTPAVTTKRSVSSTKMKVLTLARRKAFRYSRPLRCWGVSWSRGPAASSRSSSASAAAGRFFAITAPGRKGPFTGPSSPSSASSAREVKHWDRSSRRGPGSRCGTASWSTLSPRSRGPTKPFSARRASGAPSRVIWARFSAGTWQRVSRRPAIPAIAPQEGVIGPVRSTSARRR
jgi:hypothetical protein